MSTTPSSANIANHIGAAVIPEVTKVHGAFGHNEGIGADGLHGHGDGNVGKVGQAVDANGLAAMGQDADLFLVDNAVLIKDGHRHRLSAVGGVLQGEELKDALAGVTLGESVD